MVFVGAFNPGFGCGGVLVGCMFEYEGTSDKG